MEQGAGRQGLRWADRLTDVLLPILRHQLEGRGADHTGAYNFYAMRLERFALFLEYEIALAKTLLSCRLNLGRIDEIGSGFGQLMFLLGWNGFQVCGFEADKARAQTAHSLWQVLNLVDPALTRNVRLFAAEFPFRAAPRPQADSLIVTTNLVASRTPQQQAAVLSAMKRYPYVLCDVQRFFEFRPARAQEHETLSLFASAGLSRPELFLDLDSGGRYYLFSNPVESERSSRRWDKLRRFWT
jgi:hypothetical protein